MRSRTGAALLLMALGFLLLGLATLRWELVSLVIPLGVMLYLALVLDRLPLMDVAFSRSLEAERVQEGDTVEVALRLENRGEALDYVEVVDEAPSGASVVEGRARFPLTMAAGEVVEVRYTLRFDRRGSYSFGDTTVRWTGPAMMASRVFRGQVAGRILVLPRVQDLRRCGLRPAQLRMQAGNVPSSFLGPGTEFYCLRDYVPGDELRRINWKATARRDALMVNDLESERSGDVVIVVDARTTMSEPETRQRLLDHEADAATSLASYFLKQRSRVGVLILGSTMDVVPLGSGRRHFNRLVERLLAASPGDPRHAKFLRQVMDRYFPTSSLMVIVSPLEDAGVVGSLVEMTARGREVFALALDTFALESVLLEDKAVLTLAERMHRIRRADALAELGRNFRAVNWDPAVPLFKYLMEGRGSEAWRR